MLFFGLREEGLSDVQSYKKIQTLQGLILPCENGIVTTAATPIGQVRLYYFCPKR